MTDDDDVPLEKGPLGRHLGNIHYDISIIQYCQEILYGNLANNYLPTVRYHQKIFLSTLNSFKTREYTHT